MTKMTFNAVRSFIRDEDAPTLVEYGILVALIAVIGAVGVGQFGGSLSNLLNDVTDALP
jgi:Flp pilus assembly pilin Flp